MPRNRRRSARVNTQKSTANSFPSSRSNTPVHVDDNAEAVNTITEACPACTDISKEVLNSQDKESWIRCDPCKTWYHWRCAGDGSEVENIDKWYCKTCIEAVPTRSITFKAPTRRSSRKKTQRDYANLNCGQMSDPHRWLKMLEGKVIKEDPFKRMVGSAVSIDWLENDEDAMTEPIVIENPEGLGMRMPPKEFFVKDVVEKVGAETPVEVIDVATQSTSPGWTLEKWAEYFMLEPPSREKILNVISLEISETPLADMITPPRIVKELDWVENFWPSARKGKGQGYPKVQLYCLMGVGSAWTDWHIDFAGSSVYYHILHGSKVFYFARPTPPNLAAYERWSGTELQNYTWLGDMVDEVFRVELTEGNTMIIPTGWIHAVYTPIDSLVFGGNFLHSYNVATQLKVRNIEISTQVPKKFRFPMFTRLCWYVGERYLRDLKAANPARFSHRVMTSVLALAEFLVSEARLLENGSEHSKKEAKDQIPNDRIKDAPAMARELHWRTRLVVYGSASDEEGEKIFGEAVNRKRKRAGESQEPDDKLPFKNFRPKKWDNSTEEVLGKESRLIRISKPEDEKWKEKWSGWTDLVDEEGDEQFAQVTHSRDVIVRVRKTARGIERQRIERIVEELVWENAT
ncbi:jumonji superfamily protein [Amanita muscaria]